MFKVSKHKDDLKRAIILSITLHCVLIAILIWSSIHQSQEASVGGREPPIDAVMLNPNAIVQQYNRQKQSDAQQAEQQRLKALKKQRLAYQKKQAEAATAVEAKQEAAAQAKSKQTTVTNPVKAKANVKAKGDKAAKAKADDIKQSSEVDDLLGVLTNAKNKLKSAGAVTRTSNNKLSGASGSEINGYLDQVRKAISNKFYDSSNYRGKTCILYTKLAPDGVLISVSYGSGDLALCQAAISAAKLAAIPRPPSPKVYEEVKNVMLDFKP
ncbi:MAG: cell envelope integrity protein TolA [Sodalis sp. (in: enterobacteria)]